MYYTHKEGFEDCSIRFDFFCMSSASGLKNFKEVKARLVVSNEKGVVLIEKKSMGQIDEKDKDSDWTIEVEKKGTYTIRIENLDTEEMVGVAMVTFMKCSKYNKVLQKEEMSDINQRAEKAIGTLFHNIVELEQSESRLVRRKQSSLS